MFEEDDDWKLDSQYVKVTPIQFIKILKTWYPGLSLKFAKNLMDELWRRSWERAEVADLAHALEKARERVEARLVQIDQEYRDTIYAVVDTGVRIRKLEYDRHGGRLHIETFTQGDASALYARLTCVHYTGSRLVDFSLTEE